MFEGEDDLSDDLGDFLWEHEEVRQYLDQLPPMDLKQFEIAKLAADSHATVAADGAGGIRWSVIITVDQPDEVDALAVRVRAAGGTLTKEPTDGEFFEGRDAYFTDPEGNLWEIAWAPPDNPVSVAARRAAGLPE